MQKMTEQESGLSNESDLKSRIDPEKVPVHVAIIMDGNGRWARKNRMKRTDGHREGVKTARRIAECAARLGIRYLTFYTFSTENWKRPRREVNTLMNLLHENLLNNKSLLEENDIRLRLIGDERKLPGKLRKELQRTIKMSGKNQGMQINMALNYGGRAEILQAVKRILIDRVSPDRIDEKLFQEYLYTGKMPDPDLLIRTSGEMRVSNFLLYQLAYSELYFSERLWPEFREEDFYRAVIDYQNRGRRFGTV
jgi:undecaprenyl diphosphate synthase